MERDNQGLFLLQGRIALVTGGNGGLGRAMALGLVEAGALVAVTGRNERKNLAIAKRLGEPGAVFALDVRDEDAVKRVVAALVECFGHLDVLINNAGNALTGPVPEVPLEEWRSVIENASHRIVPVLEARVPNHDQERPRWKDHQHRVDVLDLRREARGELRSAKTGVLGLTRGLAVELAAYGIQVNAILPGWFETDHLRGMPRSEEGQLIRRKTPTGRWGNPDDLVGAAVFFGSQASDFVTGAALPVDGGYSVADRLLAE